MNFQYASDLHLEFPENREYIRNNPIQPKGEVLLLGGDIVPFAILDKHMDFFDYLSDHFEAAYWVPGNHEYYHYDLAGKCGTVNEKIKSNVFLVNNVSATHGETRILFSTLWTSISEQNKMDIQYGMNDFQVIKYKEERFLPDHYNEQHRECLTFLRNELEQKAKQTVVVTHHVPTFKNYPEQYKGDILNEAFAVELFDLIEDTGPDFWIFGHHHQNVPAFTIGKTKLMTNQLGYVGYGEGKGFDHGLSGL